MSTSPYLEDLGFMLVQFRKLEHSAAMGGRAEFSRARTARFSAVPDFSKPRARSAQRSDWMAPMRSGESAWRVSSPTSSARSAG